jgi:hypothetical protein
MAFEDGETVAGLNVPNAHCVITGSRSSATAIAIESDGINSSFMTLKRRYALSVDYIPNSHSVVV